MITAGSKLTSLAMVKCAMEQGFALKIVENVFVEGIDEDDKYWSGISISVDYVAYADNRSTIRQYLAQGEIFAVTMEEYDESIDWRDDTYGWENN